MQPTQRQDDSDDPVADSPPRPARQRSRTVDVVIALAVASLVLVVHNLGFILHHPFWLDENWVADSTRAPLHDLPRVTSSTPLGWSLLLRLVPFPGTQRLRLVPLAFCGATVLAAYALGVQLRITRVVTAVILAAAALLAPAMLIQNDLKQYTAEAFFAVLIMLLLARVESHWTRRRLAQFALITGLGLLFADATVFVGAAAISSLGLVTLVGRQWRRLAEVVVTGVVMVAIQGIIYIGVDRPNQDPALTAYWAAYYVPRNKGIHAALTFVHRAVIGLEPYFGFRTFAVSTVLALGGIATLLWLRHPALALITPLTIAAQLTASAFRKYPFGDLRTSTFMIVMVVELMAIGAAGVVRLAQATGTLRGLRTGAPQDEQPHATGRWMALTSGVAAGSVAVVALGLWAYSTRSYFRLRNIPDEDVAAEINYVTAHRRPGDVVMFDYAASYGIAYYDQQVRPSFEHVSYSGTGFVPYYPNVPWLVEVYNREPVDVDRALGVALGKIAHDPAARIWVIRTHLEPPEADEWARDLKGDSVQTLAVGPEPLLLVTPSRSATPNPAVAPT